MASPDTSRLERELEELLGVERFEPPEEFREQALWNDPKVYEEAEADWKGWWERQAQELLDWAQPWDTVLNDEDPPFYRWFEGGKLNASYNCLDRHVEAGRGDRVAFHWRGEEGEERDVTYADLLRDVQKLANALRDRGIGPGDVVGIFLPMIPEVVVAMLACARIGAPHNVVFGGFSPESVRERMEFSDARALITVDGARRKGKTAPIKAAVDECMGDLEIETIVVVRHTETECEMREGRDVWYHEALEAAEDECPAEPLYAEHPLFILYTSGSTAKPKGILHTTGGYLTGAAYTQRYVFDLKPEEDVWWCSADVGWVTGHTYIVYGPLLNGATSVMYEGAPDYPDKDIWWELCDRYDVTLFYTAPTAIRACMKWGAQYPERHDLSSLRLLGTVGEPINPKAWLWYHKVIGGERCPIVDTWWQTETGSIMISPLPAITTTKPGSATVPLPGVSAAVVDEDGNEIDEGQGLLVIQRPWPSMLRTLYREDERFVETYFSKFGPSVYVVGDAARRDEDGYFWIVGRIDDVINVSGHRLSTAEVESAIVSHGKVAEAAVIGQADEDSGQAICAFVTLEGDLEGSDEMVEELREHVAVRIGKLARPKRIIWSADLPKTRSGKIMRRLLRDIAEGRELGDVTTLRDPGVMKDLEGKFAKDGEE
ncbi:MAG: acetyl-CoA synthetase [Solirubrobacteraceae bacterium]|jgi:acetyl-CoA synthetase|nr:acetyl-CoA synthetase [Solirubrobacteraceae bacterium]